MSNTPFYSAQSGGKFAWIVGSINNDYSDQLVKIEGLNRNTGFDGAIKTPEITITLAGLGLIGNDGLNYPLFVSLKEVRTNNVVDFGIFIIKNIEKTEKITVLKCVGLSDSALPDDFYAYIVPAQNPRNLCAGWIDLATNGSLNLNVPEYTGGGRGYARVAAPAATLKVNGIVEQNYSIHVRGDNKVDYPTTSWSSVVTAPPIIDVQRDLAPEFACKRAFLGNVPLWWHQRNQTWQVTISARATNPAVTTDKCQFPLGLLQDVFYTMALQNGAINNPTLYFSAEREIQPGEQRETQINFANSKQARLYAQKVNKRVATVSTVDQKAITETEVGNNSVIISNFATYNAIKMPWYNEAKSVIAPTATTITAPTNDSLEMQKITIRSNSSAVVTFASNAGLSINNIFLKSARLDSSWISLGINSASKLKSTYQMQQWGIKPVTIDQKYVTKNIMQQAARLGSLGFYESVECLTACDLCPESGTVFALPLNENDAVEVLTATSHPLPGIIGFTFMDVKGDEHTYNYYYSDGDAATSDNFTICQAHTQSWQQPTNNRLSIASNSWEGNPGGLCDRWTGSTYNPNTNTLSFTSPSSYMLDAFKLLTETGDLISLTGYNNITSSANYSVRTLTDQQYSFFLTSGEVVYTGNIPTSQSKVAPYLEIFPVLSWLQANKRVFSDNFIRQSFFVKTTLAFASAVPGDILAVQLDKILDKNKSLALVIGVEVSTEGYCNLEIVPMHKITNADYTNFTNLGEILP